MKKTVLILSVLAFIASACKQATKNQQAMENIQDTTIAIMPVKDSCTEQVKTPLFEETKNLMLNNKKHTITFNYYLVSYSDYYLTKFPDDNYKDIKWTALSIYFDDKEIYTFDDQVPGLHAANPNTDYFNENETFNTNATKNEIIALIKKINPYGIGIKDIFTVITGSEGKEYLIFIIEDIQENNSLISYSFINDKGEILFQDINPLCSFIVFKDSITDANYMNGDEKQPFYIKNNKFHSVEMECNWDDGLPYSCKIYEKTLSVEQNKVNEEKQEIKTITVNYDYCQ